MVTTERWKQAQAYERSYWEGQARAIATGAISQLDWYRWRADQLSSKLRALGLDHLTTGEARVVEVGCGPIGTIAFFPAQERVAIDPLEPFYSRDAVLTALRDPAVQYLEGVGEALPCRSGGYDLAIIDNCIDHVRDVGSVRRELARVLRHEGILYLTVNCRTRWGFVVHRLLSRLVLDPGHPHTFTPARARRFLDVEPFRVLGLDAESPWAARRADLTSGQPRARLKGLLGVSEFLVSVVARRNRDESAGP